MYVAVKGGETAIKNAHDLLAKDRRGDPTVPEISVDQIREQLSLAVDRVMAEGSLYDPELAALALKQARGDMIEAVFLLRAYRTTLPRFASTEPLKTGEMRVERRISGTFKDIPGGQILGPTFDYTHRLLDPRLLEPQAEADPSTFEPAPNSEEPPFLPSVMEIMGREGLIQEEPRDSDRDHVSDLTREPLSLPAPRDMRLQNLARADEGYLLCLGYSTQRGYGRNHAFAGEIRMGDVAVELVPQELGFAIEIGDITVTECQMVNQFQGSATAPAQFTRGYGLAFGRNERKTMAMALVDRAMRSEELGEATLGPAQDPEFVLYHSDNVEAQGFVQHLKLPHHVDFQSELALVRSLREAAARAETEETAE